MSKVIDLNLPRGFEECDIAQKLMKIESRKRREPKVDREREKRREERKKQKQKIQEKNTHL